MEKQKIDKESEETLKKKTATYTGNDAIDDTEILQIRPKSKKQFQYVLPGSTPQINMISEENTTQSSSSGKKLKSILTPTPHARMLSRDSTPMSLYSRDSTPMSILPLDSTQLSILSRASTPLSILSRDSTPQSMLSRDTTPLSMFSIDTTPLRMLSRDTTPLGMLSRDTTPLGMLSRATTPLGMLSRATTPLGIIQQDSTPQMRVISTVKQPKKIRKLETPLLIKTELFKSKHAKETQTWDFVTLNKNTQTIQSWKNTKVTQTDGSITVLNNMEKGRENTKATQTDGSITVLNNMEEGREQNIGHNKPNMKVMKLVYLKKPGNAKPHVILPEIQRQEQHVPAPKGDEAFHMFVGSFPDCQTTKVTNYDSFDRSTKANSTPKHNLKDIYRLIDFDEEIADSEVHQLDMFPLQSSPEHLRDSNEHLLQQDQVHVQHSGLVPEQEPVQSQFSVQSQSSVQSQLPLSLRYGPYSHTAAQSYNIPKSSNNILYKNAARNDQKQIGDYLPSGGANKVCTSMSLAISLSRTKPAQTFQNGVNQHNIPTGLPNRKPSETFQKLLTHSKFNKEPPTRSFSSETRELQYNKNIVRLSSPAYPLLSYNDKGNDTCQISTNKNT